MGLPPAAQALMMQQLLAGHYPAAQTATAYAAQLQALRAPSAGSARLPQFQLLPYPYAGFGGSFPGHAAFSGGLEGSGQHHPLHASGRAAAAGAVVGGRVGGAAHGTLAKLPSAKVAPLPAASIRAGPTTRTRASAKPPAAGAASHSHSAGSGDFGEEAADSDGADPHCWQPLSNAQRAWLVRLTSTAFFKDCPRCVQRARGALALRRFACLLGALRSHGVSVGSHRALLIAASWLTNTCVSCPKPPSGPVHSATYFDIDDPAAGALCGICIEDRARAGHEILQVGPHPKNLELFPLLSLLRARPVLQ
jgi:hypothetical protein